MENKTDAELFMELLKRGGIEFTVDYNNQKPSELFIEHVPCPTTLITLMITFTQDGKLEEFYGTN